MGVVIQASNREWYVNRRARCKKTGRRWIYRDWYLIKHCCAFSTKRGSIELGTVRLPKEFIGKRIRFKLEVLK